MSHINTKSATEQKHRKPRNLNYDIITKEHYNLITQKQFLLNKQIPKQKKIFNKQATYAYN